MESSNQTKVEDYSVWAISPSCLFTETNQQVEWSVPLVNTAELKLVKELVCRQIRFASIWSSCMQHLHNLPTPQECEKGISSPCDVTDPLLRPPYHRVVTNPLPIASKLQSFTASRELKTAEGSKQRAKPTVLSDACFYEIAALEFWT